MTEESKSSGNIKPRAIDNLILLWVLIYALFSYWSGVTARLPLGIAPVILVLFLTLRSEPLSGAKHLSQLLSLTIMSLMSAVMLLFAPVPVTLLKVMAVAVLFLWGFNFSRRLTARAFGLSLAATTKSNALRKQFLWPIPIAVSVAAIGMGAMAFRPSPDTNLLVLILWLLPFATSWYLLRRLDSRIAVTLLRQRYEWQVAFGSPRTVVTVILAMLLVGFGPPVIWLLAYQPELHAVSLVETLLRGPLAQQAIAWWLVCGILLFQGLVLVQLQRWASEMHSGSTQPA